MNETVKEDLLTCGADFGNFDLIIKGLKRLIDGSKGSEFCWPL